MHPLTVYVRIRLHYLQMICAVGGCRAVLKYCGNTTNLASHLKSYLKVAALAHVSKSNPYNFWWRGRVMDLNYISEVLCRSLLACASYGRKEKVKIATNSKCYLIN